MVNLRDLIGIETLPEEMDILLGAPFDMSPEDIGLIFKNGQQYSGQFEGAEGCTERWFRKHYDYSPESTIFLSYLYNKLTPNDGVENPIQIYKAHIDLMNRFRREGENVNPSIIYDGERTFREGLAETAQMVENSFHRVDLGVQLSVESALICSQGHFDCMLGQYLISEGITSLFDKGTPKFYTTGTHRLRSGMGFRFW